MLKKYEIINGLRSKMISIVECPEYNGHFALQINYSDPRIFACGFSSKLDIFRAYKSIKIPNRGLK